MPYQVLEKCGKLLVAARDSNIDLFSLEDGTYLSTWMCPSLSKPQNGKATVQEGIGRLETAESQPPSVELQIDASSPPAKRRKLSSGDAETVEAPKEEAEKDTEGKPDAVTKSKQDEGKKRNKKEKANNRSFAISTGLEAPAVTALTVTEDQHVVAITGEDKCIRVFDVIEVDGVPTLSQLSERIMPKRPSSVAITKDSSTILSADKFGDVYSLPLIFSPRLTTAQFSEQASRPSSAIPEKAFKPSANELTIHSQRNRIALENQKRQTNTLSEKAAPTFEHTLLLGHVSLLTDLILAYANGKNYIITADRDEHIRISRGIPQAHIIESFCLGHKEFVSRLCIPESRPEILVSGGGDDELFAWDWKAGELFGQADLRKYVRDVIRDDAAKERKIIVSGIYHTHNESDDIVLVTCEGVPAIFVFNLKQNTLSYSRSLALPGNVLSLTTTPARVIASIDTTHAPGSTTEPRAPEASVSSIYSFIFKSGLLEEDPSFKVAAVNGPAVTSADGSDKQRLNNLLYSLENLRKRTGDGAEAEELA